MTDQTFRPSWGKRGHTAVALAILMTGLVALPAGLLAQTETAPFAVVDAGRVFQESDFGLNLLEGLKQLREQKQEEGRLKQEAAKELQDRITQSRLALSPEKLEELQKELEEKLIDLQRFEDDATREIDKASSEAMGSFNQQIMPVIDGLGRERGFTLIFNKFEAGLLFAAEQVDVTEAVIERFNELNPAETAAEPPSE